MSSNDPNKKLFNFERIFTGRIPSHSKYDRSHDAALCLNEEPQRDRVDTSEQRNRAGEADEVVEEVEDQHRRRRHVCGDPETVPVVAPWPRNGSTTRDMERQVREHQYLSLQNQNWIKKHDDT